MALEEALRRLGELVAPAKAADPRPLLVLLAGSNGAGKTTFYGAYLSDLPLPFVNADAIARELRGGRLAAPPDLAHLEPDEAARRLADDERQACLHLRRSFITETVLSDPYGKKVEMLEEARRRGFEVWLVFIGIGSPALGQARVHERVRFRGGHDVPPDRLKARYPRTLANLERAVSLASVALLLDNDLAESPYRFVALLENGRVVRRSGLRPAWAKRVLG